MINAKNMPVWMLGMFVLLFLLNGHHCAYAQVSGSGAGGANMPGDMTLWQTLKAGGLTMIGIGFLSVAAVAIIVYDVMMLNVNKLVPRGLYDEVMHKLNSRDFNGAQTICRQENSTIIAKIVLAGLERKQHHDDLAREAMENTARVELTNLWQNISYLSDIVAVAPLLGLLGTVLGLIQAFRAVPLQSASLKTTLLAAGISKAMVCTASGLIVAIPALMAYSYFRGHVQQITNMVEIYSSDIIKKIHGR
ncbi:MAG: MotA/TolQ/ExbB proton channel family protein [Candidatus Omnitrophica bacterium]|nr:MotA/TolQ/ExbB proton channel family protein [Candidatus Omnitrophota bacterium]MDE2008929.1 MotA/TolQ/ExbB proton channel family protein [Candidatus Omnitrophota bacterium]MDE2213508.1 MotA/TolQ/ExbB proton channel family protein [Candidatus Omnitrophota bacterium]MDE2230591.1 MotA/TolQ/ExbB proton channel family protein [Candidatus Omnitrophota bacterium]